MLKLITNLVIATIAFTFSVGLFHLWSIFDTQDSLPSTVIEQSPGPRRLLIGSEKFNCNFAQESPEKLIEDAEKAEAAPCYVSDCTWIPLEKFKKIVMDGAEQQAICVAQTFVAINGYTNVVPDREHISSETVEYAETLDEMLRERHDTLEAGAYGISYQGHGGSDGWTVVFRHKNCSGCNPQLGRAVTMDRNFHNLLVEHKEFILDKVSKKLPVTK